jgi:hypothetical protein
MELWIKSGFMESQLLNSYSIKMFKQGTRLILATLKGWNELELTFDTPFSCNTPTFFISQIKKLETPSIIHKQAQKLNKHKFKKWRERENMMNKEKK